MPADLTRSSPCREAMWAPGRWMQRKSGRWPMAPILRFEPPDPAQLLQPAQAFCRIEPFIPAALDLTGLCCAA